MGKKMKPKTKVDKMTQGIHNVVQQYESDTDNLIPMLQHIQREFGYISEEAVKEISKHLGISENSVYGVATFYTQFRFSRPGDHLVHVCQGTACHVRGGKRIMSEVCKHLGIQPGETTPDYTFSLERVACFGSCALAPVVVVDRDVHGRMTPQKAKQLLQETT